LIGQDANCFWSREQISEMASICGSFGEMADGEVHIWWSCLDQSQEITQRCYELLTERQRRRIDRYKTAQLRERQIVSDGLLRSLLARYLNDAPADVSLQSTEFGKPFVADCKGRINLQFSVSHSSYLGVYAFAGDKLIGVDVEEMLPSTDWDAAECLYLGGYEREWLSHLPSCERNEISYRLWTIKEAYVKAVGQGLSMSPMRIEIGWGGATDYRFERIDGKIEHGRKWQIISFTPVSNFSAAVVVEGGGASARYFHCEPSVLLNSRHQ
jgi:4'-phosphopantetheinyl transferase